MSRAIDKGTMLNLIIEAKRTDPETGSFAEWLAEYLVDHLPTLTQPNEPLTLEELREMEGKPFWDCASREWYIVAYVAGSRLYTETGTYVDFAEEETEQRFYRRPPEGEEKT